MFRQRTANVFGQGRLLLRGAVDTLPARLSRRPAVSGIPLLNGVRDQPSRLLFPLHKVAISTLDKSTVKTLEI